MTWEEVKSSKATLLTLVLFDLPKSFHLQLLYYEHHDPHFQYRLLAWVTLLEISPSSGNRTGRMNQRLSHKTIPPLLFEDIWVGEKVITLTPLFSLFLTCSIKYSILPIQWEKHQVVYSLALGREALGHTLISCGLGSEGMGACKPVSATHQGSLFPTELLELFWFTGSGCGQWLPPLNQPHPFSVLAPFLIGMTSSQFGPLPSLGQALLSIYKSTVDGFMPLRGSTGLACCLSTL